MLPSVKQTRNKKDRLPTVGYRNVLRDGDGPATLLVFKKHNKGRPMRVLVDVVTAETCWRYIRRNCEDDWNYCRVQGSGGRVWLGGLS
jgi:hypothetical protein